MPFDYAQGDIFLRFPPLIPHAKFTAEKKTQLYICPGHLNPMARMPVKHIVFINGIGRRNSGTEPNRRTAGIAFQKTVSCQL